ncbi:Holliday junction resolvase RecU [Ureaplasma ceti]
MYLETIINNSIKHYENHKIALFRKQPVPIRIRSVHNLEVTGYLESKCDVDYYGVYQGRFIALEAKQTSQDFFSYHQLLPHQIEYLQLVQHMQGLSYLIIFFQKTEHFYLVSFLRLWAVFQDNSHSKRIYETELKQISQPLELYFPGWLDFIKKIETV